jgi:acetyl-CoA synthetase
MADKKLSGDVYYPSEEIIKSAHAKCEQLYDSAEKDYLGFWEKEASELHWFKKWDKVFDDSKKPFYKWFVNGKTNIAYNCLDVHCETYRRNKVALIWEGENGDFRSLSYFALRRETCRFANVLRSLGVKKGDRVTIYMGRIPEIVTAMLACARIGAIHSVVYGGLFCGSSSRKIRRQPIESINCC